MKPRRSLCTAALALAAASTPSYGQGCPTVICGQQACGFSCTYHNVDVVIRDVQIDPACQTCSFSVTVYNGTITVEGFSGLNGDGASGSDAVAVNQCDGQSVGAGSPRAGCQITLKSLPSPFGGSIPRPLGITVSAGISARGGNGGSGSTTSNERFEPPECIVCPNDAVGGTPGAAGGHVTLQSDGPIVVWGNIDVGGGRGGHGTTGTGSRYGSGTAGLPGRDGGAGGVISIKQGGTDAGPSLDGSLFAEGGEAGDGGGAGGGTDGSADGGHGGNGGAGGSVEVSGPEPSVFLVSTVGGAGGTGGAGGHAPDIEGYVCDSCPTQNGLIYRGACGEVENGHTGGAGGDGGHGGPVSISTSGTVSVSGFGAAILTEGGDGAMGGTGGTGDAGFLNCPGCPSDNSGCNATLQCPAVSSHGTPGASGDGGNGGRIHIKCNELVTGAYFSTVGGCGGDGQEGIAANCVLRIEELVDCGQSCPCPQGYIVCNEMSAKPGAAGGAGGNAGDIDLVLGVPLNAPNATFRFCGGGGGAGGTGGDGLACPNWVSSGAGGGIGGLAGASGVFSASGSPPVGCVAPVDDCGPQFPHYENGVWVYRGADGASGGPGGCPCNIE